MGWLNTRGTIPADTEPIQWAETLLHQIEQACTDRDILIAHVKLHLQGNDTEYKVSLTQNGNKLSWDMQPASRPNGNLNFILNARAHTSPYDLEQIIRDAIQGYRQPQYNCIILNASARCHQSQLTI